MTGVLPAEIVDRADEPTVNFSEVGGAEAPKLDEMEVVPLDEPLVVVRTATGSIIERVCGSPDKSWENPGVRNWVPSLGAHYPGYIE